MIHKISTNKDKIVQDIFKKYEKQIEEIVRKVVSHEKIKIILSRVPHRSCADRLDVGSFELSYVFYHNHDTHSSSLDIARWDMYKMHGCCGICVSTGVYVLNNFQNKGLGTLTNKMRIEIARELKFGVLVCTDVTTNKAQRRILEKNGWQEIYQFKNPRTNHNVGVHLINLTTEYNAEGKEILP